MEKELASLLMSSFTEFFCLFLVLLFPSWLMISSPFLWVLNVRG